MSLLTKFAPTTASIQKEYVDKRYRQLHKKDDAKVSAVQAKVEALMARAPPLLDFTPYYITLRKVEALMAKAPLC